MPSSSPPPPPPPIKKAAAVARVSPSALSDSSKTSVPKVQPEQQRERKSFQPRARSDGRRDPGSGQSLHRYRWPSLSGHPAREDAEVTSAAKAHSLPQALYSCEGRTGSLISEH
ncbi:hypothetical protein Q9966_012393 [Columba livia]|nr:hypothetical protein Q9966_012393 [Columba livia]